MGFKIRDRNWRAARKVINMNVKHVYVVFQLAVGPDRGVEIPRRTAVRARAELDLIVWRDINRARANGNRDTAQSLGRGLQRDGIKSVHFQLDFTFGGQLCI